MLLFHHAASIHQLAALSSLPIDPTLRMSLPDRDNSSTVPGTNPRAAHLKNQSRSGARREPETEGPSSQSGLVGANADEGYILSVGPHDVLLGRGTGPNKNKGNVEFRNIVEDCKPKYISTSSRKIKSAIVQDAIDTVKNKNGRFLSKLSKAQLEERGISHEVAYEIAPNAVAIEKVKQALRYICYKKEGSKIITSSPVLAAVGSNAGGKRPSDSLLENSSDESEASSVHNSSKSPQSKRRKHGRNKIDGAMIASQMSPLILKSSSASRDSTHAKNPSMSVHHTQDSPSKKRGHGGSLINLDVAGQSLPSAHQTPITLGQFLSSPTAPLPPAASISGTTASSQLARIAALVAASSVALPPSTTNMHSTNQEALAAIAHLSASAPTASLAAPPALPARPSAPLSGYLHAPISTRPRTAPSAAVMEMARNQFAGQHVPPNAQDAPRARSSEGDSLGPARLDELIRQQLQLRMQLGAQLTSLPSTPLQDTMLAAASANNRSVANQANHPLHHSSSEGETHPAASIPNAGTTGAGTGSAGPTDFGILANLQAAQEAQSQAQSQRQLLSQLQLQQYLRAQLQRPSPGLDQLGNDQATASRPQDLAETQRALELPAQARNQYIIACLFHNDEKRKQLLSLLQRERGDN